MTSQSKSIYGFLIYMKIGTQKQVPNKIFATSKGGKTFLPKPFLCIDIPILYISTSGWCYHLRDHSSLCYQGSSPQCSYFPNYCMNLKMKLSLDSSALVFASLLSLGLFIVKDSRRKVIHQGKSSFQMKTVS